MDIQRGSPTLAGVKPCPSCKAQIEKDAVLCIHCGYNLATGQKVAGESWLAANKKLVFLAGGGIAVLLVVLAALFLFTPEPPPPPPPFVPSAAPVAVLPAAPATPEPSAESAPVAEEKPAPEPEAPADPTPEELAAQQAEAERLAREAEEARIQAERAEFEAKKVQAEQSLREQLESREPMFKLGDEVELRRRNGVVHKGELQRFSGTGTDRVAVVATAVGEIGVPLVTLDPPSRRRMDRDYREAFIAHMLSTKLPDPATDEAEDPLPSPVR
jgi:hypothetical protein